jgi:hypothetical protein
MAKSYAEIVADEIKAAGFSIGVMEYLDESGRRMRAANAHKSYGNRWIARARIRNSRHGWR